MEYCEDAWLLLRLKNYASCLADKESNCKYYFIDNGILNLFLINQDSMLLENIAALHLFRVYGHDADNDRVFFYNDSFEVDFYVPEDELAVQVCFSLRDEETRKRELDALGKLAKRLPCKRRIVITYDEENVVSDKLGDIAIMPCWKWLMGHAARENSKDRN